jgi:hypothetical protein
MAGTCNVSLGEYDGDEAAVYHESIVKARKAHVCFECGDQIPVGAKYERVSGLWDAWATYRFCLPCAEIGREFSVNGRQFGYIWEGMRDNWDEGANLQACLNRLTSAHAKRKLRDEWLKFKKIV